MFTHLVARGFRPFSAEKEPSAPFPGAANPDLTIFLPLAVVRVLPSKTAIFEKRAPVVAEFCHLPAIRLPGCVFTGVMSKQAQKKQKREAHKAGGK